MKHFTRDDGSSIFTVEKLGRTQELTPEGFLLCRDVVVARLGVMVYVADELPGITPGKDGLIRVTVTEEALFDPDAMASFNGKDVTDDHPDDMIDSENSVNHTVGVMLNVHRGEGVDNDKLVADLLIKKAAAIKKVRDGKVQVSLGYDANYEAQTEPGRAIRTKMVGNHIALTFNGRCGPSCAIGDSDMAKTDWRAKLLAAFTNRDSAALTEALAAAPKDDDGDESGHRTIINIAAPAKDAAKSKDEEPEPDDKGATTDAFKGIKDSLDRLSKRMDSMEESIKEVKEGKDAKRGKDAPDDPDEELKVEGATDEDEVETAEERAAKEGKDGKGKGAKDSGILAAIQDTKSRAEILVPGVQFWAFDAKDAKTADRLCAFKRKVLAKAITTDRALVPGNHDPKTMTCDAVNLAFIFASDAKAAKNNESSRTDETRDVLHPEATRKTIADINAANAKFWSGAA